MNRHSTQLPTDMLIADTNKCNQKCIFCIQCMNIPSGGGIDAYLLEKVLREAYDLGVRRVGLYSMGEMFMCKDIHKHITTAHKLGFKYIYSDTNGVLATEVNLRKVIKAGLHSLKFSINAGTKETYKLIHGSDDFETVLENLEICHRLKSEMNPKLKIMVSFVVTKQTENEVGLLQKVVESFADVFIYKPVFAFIPQHNVDISSLATDKFASNATIRRVPCSQVMDRIHVTHNGFLSACCMDYCQDLLLADLKKESLKDAWFSKNAVDFRNRHMERNTDGTLCHGCTQRKFIPYKKLKI